MRVRIQEDNSLFGRQHFGWLGQGTTPDAALIALSEARPYKNVQEIFSNARGLAVTKDGSQIAQVLALTSNSQYYVFLPYGKPNPQDMRLYVAMLPYTGASAGKLLYTPIDEFMSNWLLVAPAKTAAVFDKLPTLMAIDSPVTTNTLFKAIQSGINFAYEALNATLSFGRTKEDALRVLNAVGGPVAVGARGALDQANSELRILYGMGIVTSDEFNNISELMLDRLAAKITEAGDVIRIGNESGIKDFILKLNSLMERTSVQLRDMVALPMWKRILTLISSVQKTIQLDQDALQIYLNLPQKTDEDLKRIERQKVVVDRGRILMDVLRGELRNVGLSEPELQSEMQKYGLAGLGQPPQAVAVKLGLWMTILFTLWRVLQAIFHATIQGLGFAGGGIVVESMRNHAMSEDEMVQEFKKKERAEKRAGIEIQKDAEYQRLSNEKTAGMGKLYDQNGLRKEAGKIYATTLDDPKTKANVEQAAKALDNAGKQTADVGIETNQSRTKKTFIYAGMVAGAGLLLMLLFPKKKKTI